ncbi:hypothetical protein C0J52_22034 [Blattella germanica]|nr:hypothetical protein C0J52_22034 [Blattella germanica]
MSNTCYYGLSSDGSNCRIDIIAIKSNTSEGYIIDPMVRFESHANQIHEIDSEKNHKYEGSIEYYKQKYGLFSIAIIGGWDKKLEILHSLFVELLFFDDCKSYIEQDRSTLKIYLIQFLQGLHLNDYRKRQMFCEVLGEMIIMDPELRNKLFWSDELTFHLSRKVNVLCLMSAEMLLVNSTWIILQSSNVILCAYESMQQTNSGSEPSMTSTFPKRKQTMAIITEKIEEENTDENDRI